MLVKPHKPQLNNVYYRQPMLCGNPPTFRTPDGIWEVQILFEVEETEKVTPFQDAGYSSHVLRRRTEVIHSINCKRLK